MKIISWNVNGIRAWHKKGYLEWFLKESPDIFCLQETKAHPEQLTEELRNPKGYHSYFDHSKGRKGYSGVAVYSKIKPEKIEYGLGVKELDQEGRFIALHFKKFVLINTYFPNGGGGPVRLKYKLDYYKAYLKYADNLRKKGQKIIFCGDINTAHTEIDLARPRENVSHTGFLPIERAWLDKVIEHGYIDVFRHFYPHKTGAYTYWDSYSFARDRNVGWRIDYFFVSPDLIKKVKNMAILSDVFGSDHCPILLEIDI
ncbi:MAG TPA: exodeoxyribonuclease III [Candidatus Paceibacterota bacterium]|nr:exodeoxyribonuclease III [Candidatus Paceibacterota bacterium]